MSLYRFGADELSPLPTTTFEEAGLYERGDLQRLLRDQPDAIEDGLYVVAEEFGDWDESRRRIDLLCLDRAGRLAVVELKRTEDGGHMDLQAVRYAAMVASMTAEQLVRAHAQYLEQRGEDRSAARQRLRSHLGVGPDDELTIESAEPRIVLVSADFSRELTTSVLWLNDVGLDIRCVRLRPYRLDDELLIDVTQVIPLPESEDYLVRVREKSAEEDEVRRSGTSDRMHAYQRFFAELLAAVKQRDPSLTQATRTQPQSWFSFAAGRSGASFAWAFTGDGRFKVELTVDTANAATNRRILDALMQERETIEQMIGQAIEWLPSESRRAQRLSVYWPAPLTITSPSAELEAAREWAVDLTLQFVGATKPRLATIAFD